MVRLAFTLVGDSSEAEDLVQDSFVEVARRFVEIRQPGAYLRSAVVSRCKSALRRRQLSGRARAQRPDDLSNDANELWDVLEKLGEHQSSPRTSSQSMVIVWPRFDGTSRMPLARLWRSSATGSVTTTLERFKKWSWRNSGQSRA